MNSPAEQPREARSVYQARRDEFSKQARRAGQMSNRISNARLVMFLIALAGWTWAIFGEAGMRSAGHGRFSGAGG
jgi:hypothetical protein